jgi:tRNA pseudouridine38-40 synthase
MRNLKLILEYEGTAYHGWQVQPGLPTVQGALEASLGRIAGAPVHVTGASRTDAGVHARGQVANFRSGIRLDPPRLRRALNHLLPPDIVVREVVDVPADFDARRAACGKSYHYRILRGEVPSAFERNLALHWPAALDGEAMREAARWLVGEHDFTSFRASHCTAPSPVKTVRAIEVVEAGPRVEVRITADAFLQHMVRIIVGTLLEVGRGRLSPKDVERILAARDRRAASKTIAARGLWLMAVEYRADGCAGG